MLFNDKLPYILLRILSEPGLSADVSRFLYDYCWQIKLVGYTSRAVLNDVTIQVSGVQR